MSVRPPCAFSDTFHADTLEKGLFSSQEEKESYERVKSGIQKYIIETKPFETTTFEVNSTIHNFAGTTVYYKGTIGKFEDFFNVDDSEAWKSRLSDRVLARLKNRIETRGFSASIHRCPYMSTTTKSLGASISISIPKNDKDESGYVSDGWEESFKASFIKRATNKSKSNS